jgi:hypothetical protein
MVIHIGKCILKVFNTFTDRPEGIIVSKLKISCHYVYPCQRFSTENTLEDYNP